MAGFNAVTTAVTLDKTTFPSASSLREGGFVFVRVLSNSANGKSLVSFAGKQFEVTAQLNVKPGDSFKAQIKMNNGTVQLIPVKQAESAQSMTAINNTNFASPQNAALFASLGLPADSTIFKLLQQMQQNGLKINTNHILKAKRLSQKFVGSEDEAAEAALSLLEKGIEADSDSVTQLLNVLHNGNYSGGQSSESDTDEEKKIKKIDDFLEKLYMHSFKNTDEGLLTLYNHLSSNAKHWIILPYEYSSEQEDKKDLVDYTGTIRILCDRERKTAEKVGISVFSSKREITFLVDINSYDKFSISSLKKTKMHIYYSSIPHLTLAEQDEYTNTLLNIFLEDSKEGSVVDVTYSGTLDKCSFFSPDKSLYSVHMDV